MPETLEPRRRSWFEHLTVEGSKLVADIVAGELAKIEEVRRRAGVAQPAGTASGVR